MAEGGDDPASSMLREAIDWARIVSTTNPLDLSTSFLGQPDLAASGAQLLPFKRGSGAHTVAVTLLSNPGCSAVLSQSGSMRASSDKPTYPLYLTCICIVCWYAANILLLLLNKFLLSSTAFRQPVFLTLCHMLACVGMGLIVSTSGFMPIKPLKSKVQFVKICMLSVIFCATIVLGNASLKYLPVSFTQAIGATTPFFTAIFAFMCMEARESTWTYLSLVPIMAGIAIASGGEPLFHLVGFLFCMMATAGRALKSVAQAIIMADQSEKLDPMSLLLYMSAVCVVFLVPLTLVLEPTALAAALSLAASKPGFTWWLLGNSMLAYFVNLTNFLVTKFTSPLTLQVLGNAKGVLAAFISILIFMNPVTTSGICGYAMTVGGVFLYSEAKRRTKAPPSHATSSSAPSVTSCSANTCSSANAPVGDATVVLSITSSPSPLRSKDPGVVEAAFTKITPRSGKDPLSEAKGKTTSYLKDMLFRFQDRSDGEQHRV